MKLTLRSLPKSLGGLAVAALLAGCAGLTSQRDADPNQLEGVAYFMPMKYFTLTVTKEGGKVMGLEWSESTAFPDLSRAYALSYTPHLIGRTSVAVEVGDNGLLSSASTNTTDSNIELAKVVASQKTNRAQLLSAKDNCTESGTFVFMFPSVKETPESVCVDVNLSIRLAATGGDSQATDHASPVHIKAGDKVPGIFYRLNRPYIATASAPGVFKTKLLFTPNESPNYFLPFGRTLFAANDGKMELTEGVLKRYTQANDGELVALLNFPASVLSAYFNAVGNVFMAFQTQDMNQITRLENELKMDALRRKLDKCKSAAKAKDEATWASLQCDAIGSDG